MRVLKRSFILLMIILVALLALSCEDLILGPENTPPLPKKYESALATLLDSLRYAYDLPALAGAVVTDTNIIDAQAVGCRRYGGPANVKANDKFHLGSNGKALTAVLIGTLVDDGLLNWDSTLPSIFPEYTESMRSEYRTVTIRDILSHSAGFMRNPNLTLFTKSPNEQRTEVVAWALKQPPVIQRGQFLYSNLGYIIAGAIVDKLTDHPYEELIFERVLQPLGMTTAGFGPMGTSGLEDQPMQHTIHYAAIDPNPATDNPPIYNSAGNLHMSIGDWGKYIQWVLACEADHPTLLSPETARMLTTAAVSVDDNSSYAFGWSVVNRQWAGGRTLTHAGSNGLNFAVVWLAPNRKFGVITVTNICSSSTVVSMDNVVGHLIDFYFNGH